MVRHHFKKLIFKIIMASLLMLLSLCFIMLPLKNVYAFADESFTEVKNYESFQIGRTFIAGGRIFNGSIVENASPYIIVNNESTEINISQYLKKHVLYLATRDDLKEDVGLDGDSLIFSTSYLTNSQTNKPLKYTDINNSGILIQDITFSYDLVNSADISISTEYTELFDYYISFTPKITSNAINNAGYEKDDSFWEDTLFSINVFLEDNVVVKIPIVFSPSDIPFKKNDNLIPNKINITTDYKNLDGQMNEYLNFYGYNIITVYPSSIVENPLDYDIWFEEDSADVGWSQINVISKEDEYGEIYFEISGKENGFQKIKFTLYFDREDGSGAHSTDIYLYYDVIGFYENIVIPIKSKTAVAYDLKKSDVFNQIVGDNYVLHTGINLQDNVISPSLDENGNQSATINFQVGSILTIEPNYTGNVNLKLTFKNNLNGNTIYIYTSIQVEYENSSWWGGLDSRLQIVLSILFVIVFLIVVSVIVLLFIRSYKKYHTNKESEIKIQEEYLAKIDAAMAATQKNNKISVEEVEDIEVIDDLKLDIDALKIAEEEFNEELEIRQAYYSSLGLEEEDNMDDDRFITAQKITEKYLDSVKEKKEPQDKRKDDEFLEKIYESRYEPKGMTRKTFFKTKDLTTRELERENERNNLELVEKMTGKDVIEIQKNQSVEQEDVYVSEEEFRAKKLRDILGFDYESILIKENLDEILNSNEDNNSELGIEEKFNKALETYEKIASNKDNVDGYLKVTYEKYEELKDAQKKSAEQVRRLKDAITNLNEEILDTEVKKISSRGKEKEIISKSLLELDKTLLLIQKDAQVAEALQKENEYYSLMVKEVFDLLKQNSEEKATSLIKAEEKLKEYEGKMSEVRKQQKQELEKEQKEKLIEHMAPVAVKVYELEKRNIKLKAKLEANQATKVNTKTEIGSLQAKLLSSTELNVIEKINEFITAKNTLLVSLINQDKENITEQENNLRTIKLEKTTFLKHIKENNISSNVVSEAEDDIILNYLKQKYIDDATAFREKAYAMYMQKQSDCNANIAKAKSIVATNIADNNKRLVKAQEAYENALNQLETLNNKIDSCQDEDKLKLAIEKLELEEKIEWLSENVEEIKKISIKNNADMEIKLQNQIQIETTDLASAEDVYEKADLKMRTLKRQEPDFSQIYKKGDGPLTKEVRLQEEGKLTSDNDNITNTKTIEHQNKDTQPLSAIGSDDLAPMDNDVNAINPDDIMQDIQKTLQEIESKDGTMQELQNDSTSLAKEKIVSQIQADEQEQKLALDREIKEIEEQKRRIEKEREELRKIEEEKARMEALVAKQKEELRLVEQAQEEARKARLEADFELKKERNTTSSESIKTSNNEINEINKIKKDVEDTKKEFESKSNIENSETLVKKDDYNTESIKEDLSGIRQMIDQIETKEQSEEIIKLINAIKEKFSPKQQTDITLNLLISGTLSEAKKAGELAYYKSLVENQSKQQDNADNIKAREERRRPTSQREQPQYNEYPQTRPYNDNRQRQQRPPQNERQSQSYQENPQNYNQRQGFREDSQYSNHRPPQDNRRVTQQGQRPYPVTPQQGRVQGQPPQPRNPREGQSPQPNQQRPRQDYPRTNSGYPPQQRVDNQRVQQQDYNNSSSVPPNARQQPYRQPLRDNEQAPPNYRQTKATPPNSRFVQGRRANQEYDGQYDNGANQRPSQPREKNNTEEF